MRLLVRHPLILFGLGALAALLAAFRFDVGALWAWIAALPRSGNALQLLALVVGSASLTHIASRVVASRAGAAHAAKSVGEVRPIRFDEPAPALTTESAPGALAALEGMVGLDSVKRQVRSLLARVEVDTRRRDQGVEIAAVSQHMVFTGPPGVGKTEVARILGQLFRDMKVVRRGHLVETDRSGLVAGYVGQTATRTLEKCREALDGVLFIDEAYALVSADPAQRDFGSEAIDTLLKFMEDNRDRLIVIVAGYPDEMQRLLDSNPGLGSRFTRRIDFPPYSPEELLEILARMAAKQQFRLPPGLADAMTPWLAARMGESNWANAREVRTLLEHAREAHALRVGHDPDADLSALTLDDFRAAARERR